MAKRSSQIGIFGVRSKYCYIAFIIPLIAISIISSIMITFNKHNTVEFASLRTFEGRLYGYTGEVYKTKTYPFMDKITKLIEQSIKDLNLEETASRDLYNENYSYYVEYFNHAQPPIVDFIESGSYYIHISCLDPSDFGGNSYRFKYKDIDFVGYQKLNYFFTDSLGIYPLEGEELEFDIGYNEDYPYSAFRWVFIVDNGKVILAQCEADIYFYDIINKRMLSDIEYIRRWRTMVQDK